MKNSEIKKDFEEYIMNTKNDAIKSYRIEANIPGPRVLLVAGVHGDEYEPILAALDLLNGLPGLLTKGVVTIVPVVNITAYRISSRYGEDGLDLARICPGKEDGSVSERNAFEVSQFIKASDYLIDLHTGGLAHDIYPMAGFGLHPSQEILETQRQMALAFNTPVIWGTDHRPNGRTLSVARDEGVPGIYLEYGGGTGTRRNVIEVYKAGFINLLRMLNMVEGDPEIVSPEERYWVEDSRPDSGYFQGKTPSPAHGIFVAECLPGTLVKAGQRFGSVLDPETNTSIDIFADIDGLVLSVRTLVHVDEGDALGSILPITEPGKVVI